MLIHHQQLPQETAVEGDFMVLNAVWRGNLTKSVRLPQLGQLLLVFPLGETAVSCASVTLQSDRYLYLLPDEKENAISLTPLGNKPAPLLLLWFSPGFIADMANFLNVPYNLQQMVQHMPLLKGDEITAVVTDLAQLLKEPVKQHVLEDYFLELVGEVLRLLRLRHLALQKLAKHRQTTIDDLLPRLLQARQFVDARYAQRFKSETVATHIGLSEFHFIRLFKAAFDTTLHQYAIRLRLDQARHLLEQPNATVTETALTVGYGSLSTFIHAFRKRFGLSPSAYQAQMRRI